MFVRLLIAIAAILSSSAWAQPIAVGDSYVSPVDEESVIERILVWPAKDNANGIYAQPLVEELKKLVEGDHRYELVDSVSSDGSTPEQLKANYACKKHSLYSTSRCTFDLPDYSEPKRN